MSAASEPGRDGRVFSHFQTRRALCHIGVTDSPDLVGWGEGKTASLAAKWDGVV